MTQPLAEDVIFLQHFGVKGQRWGVRRQNKIASKMAQLQAESDAIDVQRAAIPPSNVKRNLKIAGTVAGAAAIGIGALYARKAMKSYGNKPAAHINIRQTQKARKQLGELVDIPGGQISGDRKAVIAGAKVVHELLQKEGWVM